MSDMIVDPGITGDISTEVESHFDALAKGAEFLP